MDIVYAIGDDTYRRHLTSDDAKTLCGREAGGEVAAALPVNCDPCLYGNGRRIRAAMQQSEGPAHIDYPHEPGRLYDCPACVAECHCVAEEEPCVHCAEQYTGQEA
jgi:hypothetical protein